jgi:hypothetical protein
VAAGNLSVKLGIGQADEKGWKEWLKSLSA